MIEKVKVKVADGKERSIKSKISTFFWSADGQPISAEQFMKNFFGKLPGFFLVMKINCLLFGLIQ